MRVTSTTRARIETGGGGVVAHVELHALGRFADALGLGWALSARFLPSGERFPLHDRGKVLVHVMLTLVGPMRRGRARPDTRHRASRPDPRLAEHREQSPTRITSRPPHDFS